MTPWITVRASRLHQRIICGDTFVPQATLFPFFDTNGGVDQVLIVDAYSPDLRIFKLNETRISIPFWGSIRIVGQLHFLDERIADQLAPLWHYDPWWLLKGRRFEFESAVPTLKRTNCVDSFEEPPADLLFSLDLKAVRKVRFHVPSKEYKSHRFRPEMLPRREQVRAPVAESKTGGWRLDPLWQTDH